jgi:hypothetical protein
VAVARKLGILLHRLWVTGEGVRAIAESQGTTGTEENCRVTGFRTNRRVRVTAASARNERLQKRKRLSSAPRRQHPLQIENTSWHRSVKLHPRVRMEVGRVGDGSCRRKREHSAPPAGRRSAVRIARPKNGLTRPAFSWKWPTIRPLVPVNTTALLGSNSLILPL